MSSIRPILLCGVAASLLCGCLGTIPHAQIRTVEPVGGSVSADPLGSYAAITNLTDDALLKKVGERMVENYDEFLLSFVEFDDQGKFWDRERQLKWLHALAQDRIAQQNGALIFVFVHGWEENADVANGTVACFRHMLYELSLDERDTNPQYPRRIIGVYVGWRGLSQQLPILEQLTFWGRKNTAHKIGRGDMDELLVHLDDLKRGLTRPEVSEEKPAATRLVVMGHSFGGAIVYSALDNILKDQTLRSVVPYQRGETNEVGVITAGAFDLVVLVNPAFEALLYSGLAEATGTNKNYNADQTTVLITIGAENDQATGRFFPIGQFFPSFMQKFKPGSDEQVLNKTSLGHYQRYFDWELTSTNNDTQTRTGPVSASQRKQIGFGTARRHREKAKSGRSVEAKAAPLAKKNWEDYVTTEHAWKLQPYRNNPEPPTHAPFLVIAATSDVVDGHSGIWGDTLQEFIEDFITAQGRHKTEIEMRALRAGRPKQ